MHAAGQVRGRTRDLLLLETGREIQELARAREVNDEGLNAVLLALPELTATDRLFHIPATMSDGFAFPQHPTALTDLPRLTLFQEQAPIVAPSAFDDVVMRDDSVPAAAVFEPNFADVAPVREPTIVDPMLEPGEEPEEMLAAFELRQVLRQHQKLEQRQKPPFADIEEIYDQADKFAFELLGLNVEVALIDRGTLPHTSYSAGLAFMDRAFVVRNFFRGIDPQAADVFTILVAVHEYGEVLFHDHHQASLLEFAVAQSMGILDFYLEFLQVNYAAKMRDVSLYRLDDDTQEFLEGRGEEKEIEKMKALEVSAAARELEFKTERDQQRAIAEALIAGLNITPEMRKKYAELFSGTSELTGVALENWIKATTAQEVFEQAVVAAEQSLAQKLVKPIAPQKVSAVFLGVLARELCAARNALSQIDDEHVQAAMASVALELMERARAVVQALPYLSDAQKAELLLHPFFQLDEAAFQLLADAFFVSPDDVKEVLSEMSKNLSLAMKMAKIGEQVADLIARVEKLQKLDLDEDAIVEYIHSVAERSDIGKPYGSNFFLDKRDLAMFLLDKIVRGGLARQRSRSPMIQEEDFSRAVIAAHPRLRRELIKAVEELSAGETKFLSPGPIALPTTFASAIEDLAERYRVAPDDNVAEVFHTRHSFIDLIKQDRLASFHEELVYVELTQWAEKQLLTLTKNWVGWRMLALGRNAEEAVSAFAQHFSDFLPISKDDPYQVPPALLERFRHDSVFWTGLGEKVEPRIQAFFALLRSAPSAFPAWTASLADMTPQAFWEQLVVALQKSDIRPLARQYYQVDRRDLENFVHPYLADEVADAAQRQHQPILWLELRTRLLQEAVEKQGYGDDYKLEIFKRFVEEKLVPQLAASTGFSARKVRRLLGAYTISDADRRLIRDAAEKIPAYTPDGVASRSYRDYSDARLRFFYQQLLLREVGEADLDDLVKNYGLAADEELRGSQVSQMIATLPDDLREVLEPRLRALLP